MDKGIVGKFFQSQRISNYLEGNPKFLNSIYFKKLDTEVITPIAILEKKAKLTDLISNVCAGGNLHLLMSGKLSKIIKIHRKEGVQFFPSTILTSDNIEINDYFHLNMFVDSNEMIDIKNSTVKYYKKSSDYNLTYKTEIEYPQFNDHDDFNHALQETKQNMETLFIEKLKLFPNAVEDFFMFRHVEGGVRYVVSEKLRKEIEDAGCTGIEFQPVELSYTEWLQGREREKIYGKA